MIEFIIAILLITIVALVGSQAAQEKLTRNLTSRAIHRHSERFNEFGNRRWNLTRNLNQHLARLFLRSAHGLFVHHKLFSRY